MKIYRNLTEIKNKEKLGRRFSFTGLAILFVGMMASFIPTWYPPEEPGQTEFIRFLQANWVYISFIALPAGFICASMGSYFINRFARRRWPGAKSFARPDEVLERSLKGFDDKYTFFAWSLPASYVLVGPCGVLLLLARSDRGKISVEGEKWREPFSIGRIFTVFAREGVGNPERELQDQTEKLHKLLREADGDGENLADVPISGAVVFLNSDVQLTVKDPVIPALRANQVKDFVRRKAKEVKLETSKLRSLSKQLQENCKVSDEA